VTLQADREYERLVHKARLSHERGRSTAGIEQRDIDLARLYCYAYRTHTIGVFQATRAALQSQPAPSELAAAYRQRALDALSDLANAGMDPVPRDFRALLSTFYRYDTGIRRTLESLGQECELTGNQSVGQIAERFRQVAERISTCGGIYVTRDSEVPEQASFAVPALGITIVPLIYGDQHSWNLAVLPPEADTATMHYHHHGVEIHLGYKPLHGYTILGDCYAEVSEGYAMPIRPRTVHGYANASGQRHGLPFIFGSMSHAGWGVFFDVQPEPKPLQQLRRVEISSGWMNGTVLLDRAIAAAAEWPETRSRVLVPTERTAGSGPAARAGALELLLQRIDPRGTQLWFDSYCILSVVRGCGLLALGAAEREVSRHDHFGIPAGMRAYLRQTGPEPLVVLEAMIWL